MRVPELPRALRRAAVRVALWLSLALLPVGVLAVVQTREVVRQSEQRSAASLGALTERAAELGTQRIERVFGTAQGLGLVALSVAGDTERCDAVFRSFVDTNAAVLGAGFTDAEGGLVCAYPRRPGDIDALPLATPSPTEAGKQQIEVRPSPAGTLTPPRLMIRQPIRTRRGLEGQVHVDLAWPGLSPSPGSRRTAGGTDPDLLTFDANGRVLTVPQGVASEAALPASEALAALINKGPYVFTARAQSGAVRQFAIAPVVPGILYVIGSWDRRGTPSGPLPFAAPTPLFPVLMWAVSLAVAFAAVNRLILRHIRSLQKTMRAFARNRRMPGDGLSRAMPAELAEIASTFRMMAETVIRDEAELERTLHDKDVLLKEVHHRVKNNLQLISSIMSMKIRQLRSPEGKAVLRRLQDRVLSLATIHRNLYDTGNLSRVDARALLQDLTRQIAAMGTEAARPVEIEADFAPVQLYPDQAVPLSLLASEALTNAVKHLGAARGSGAWIRIALREEPDDRLLLEVVNSVIPDLAGDLSPVAEPGLGMSLIEAFATQLEGDLEVLAEAGTHTLRCRFAAKPFDPGLEAA